MFVSYGGNLNGAPASQYFQYSVYLQKLLAHAQCMSALLRCRQKHKLHIATCVMSHQRRFGLVSWFLGQSSEDRLLSSLMPPHDCPCDAVPTQWDSGITGATPMTTSSMSTANKHNMGVKSRTPKFSSRLATPYNPPLGDISSRTFTCRARLHRNGHFGRESLINASADRKGG